MTEYEAHALRRANAACLAFAVVFTAAAVAGFMIVIATPTSRAERSAWATICVTAAGCLWCVWWMLRRATHGDEFSARH